MKTDYFHTCFALDQIFVHLDGSVNACCMARRNLTEIGVAADAGIFAAKRHVNAMVVDANDASLCWKDCPVRQRVATRPNSEQVNKIVVYTNTFCPLACQFCSLAYTQDAPEWSESTRPKPEENTVWNARDKSGDPVPPVRVRTNNMPNLLANLRRLVADAPEPQKLFFEFTGGDSAYHPEFVEALDYLASENINITYLSSGVVPQKVMPDILRHVASGRLFITISPDAIDPDTWAKIKRRPARLFDEVLNFIHRVATTRSQQIGVKFIVLEANRIEAPVFMPFFTALGVHRFVLSEYRSQPTFFIPPLPENDLEEICSLVRHVFRNADLPDGSELTIIGLERFFDGRNYLKREPLDFLPLVRPAPLMEEEAHL